MADKIKKWLFPAVSPEFQSGMDAENVKNICYMSFAIVLFEAFTMVLFILSRDRFDRDVWISIASVYEVKRKTHSPEFGGRERRHRP